MDVLEDFVVEDCEVEVNVGAGEEEVLAREEGEEEPKVGLVGAGSGDVVKEEDVLTRWVETEVARALVRDDEAAPAVPEGATVSATYPNKPLSSLPQFS